MSSRFYISPVADAIPFDNDTNGFTADNVQDAIEETRVSATGALLKFTFLSNGNTANKWLGYTNSVATSDVLPAILPQDVELKGLTFSNVDDDVDVDVEIYKNGSLEYTWEVRNKRLAWNVGISPSPSFSQTDRVSCFLRKFASGSGDSTAQDPIVELLVKIVGESQAEGGIQNGV